MSSMYLLILVSLTVGVLAWLLFLWTVKSGQYDDVEGPKYRMLEDDDDEPAPDQNADEAGKGPDTRV